MFDYLLTHRIELKFIIILSIIFAFNAISSTSAIKQNNILFVFFNNVKNA